MVSPDGKTLAILTAGMNSLYDPNTAAMSLALSVRSTQRLPHSSSFYTTFRGANKTNPVLKQVIQQLNAHVGLVWAPDSQTLYAAGGCDDAVYAYSNNGTSFVLSNKISLGHAPNGCRLQRCQSDRPRSRRRAQRGWTCHFCRRQNARRRQQL